MQDGVHFEKAITRRKIKTFSSDAVNVKVKGKDLKIKEVQGTHDLLGRLLILVTSHNVDLGIVLLLYICHLDM